MTRLVCVVLAIACLGTLTCKAAEPKVAATAPQPASASNEASSVHCIANLKGIGLGARIWAGDHQGIFPPDFLSLSSALASPQSFVCPADQKHSQATNWAEFDPQKNVSYEYLKPGIAMSNALQEVIFRCPIHNLVAYGDGTVQEGSQSDPTPAPKTAVVEPEARVSPPESRRGASVHFTANLGTLTLVAGPGRLAPPRGRAGWPFLRKDASRWQMWFTSDRGTDPGQGAICYAESDDGVNFDTAQVLVSCSGYYQLSTPYVAKSEAGSVLYYSDWYVWKCREWANVIKCAELETGKPPRLKQTVIAGTDQLGHWMGRQRYCPSVLRHDGRWIMFFNGEAWPPRARGGRADISLGMTSSADGKVWQPPTRLACSDDAWFQRVSGPKVLPWGDGLLLLYTDDSPRATEPCSVCYRTGGWDLLWSRESRFFDKTAIEQALAYPVSRSDQPFLIRAGDTVFLYFTVLKDKERTGTSVWESSIYRIEIIEGSDPAQRKGGEESGNETQRTMSEAAIKSLIAAVRR